MSKGSMLRWQINRQINTSVSRLYEKRFHVTNRFAHQLGLEVALEGHTGCVNCLEWSQDGAILVSGSDDYNIILWQALQHRQLTTISSGHTGNIFSVKILPNSNNSVIASAAADASVRVHCAVTKECTQTYSCHSQRVKRLATSPQFPHVIWSGSEDGTVRQYDLRQSHRCTHNQSECNAVLIDMTLLAGIHSEVKCIALNSLRSEQIAVGCNDPFLRLFDMRMLGTKSSKSTSASLTSSSSTHTVVQEGDSINDPELTTVSGSSSHKGLITVFCPGHLPRRFGREPSKRFRHLVTTYASFNAYGNEIICNLGGEHVYLFDLQNNRRCLRFKIPTSTDRNASNEEKTNNFIHNCNGVKKGVKRNGTVIPPSRAKEHNTTNGYSKQAQDDSLNFDKTATITPTDAIALTLKQQGNDAFAAQNYYQAVAFYNEAIHIQSTNPILYANRAAALLKRCWEGDVYAALRDCHTALLFDPQHYKAFYRQARCLYELQWYEEALVCLRHFKDHFPDQADGYSTQRLERDIRAILMRNYDALHEDKDEDEERFHRDFDERGVEKSGISAAELRHQEDATDYDIRFVGACNTTTDIKEANFFGKNSEFIVAGSDCGCLFLWDRKSTNLIEAWHGDESIVNCLQPHPSICMLATSGIDPVVRLWSPRSRENNVKDGRREEELEILVKANQRRMNADPFEALLMNMGYTGLPTARSSRNDDDGDNETGNSDDSTIQCRTH